jgi:hypothetical protein
VWSFVWVSLSQRNSGGRKREAKAVAGQDSSNLTDCEWGCTDLLARFFPDAERVRIAATLTPLGNGSSGVREPVIVEFAGAEKAIFSAAYPLEFDDRVRLEPADGSNQSDAKVVAVQFHEGRIAVAVQFANGQGAWVKRP